MILLYLKHLKSGFPLAASPFNFLRAWQDDQSSCVFIQDLFDEVESRIDQNLNDASDFDIVESVDHLAIVLDQDFLLKDRDL